MKITAFNGSPRGERGNTHRIVEAFLEGAGDAGAETENVLLVKKKIRHCLGCFDCWTLSPGRCIIRDDMDELLPKFLGSDIAVFATPLYIDNVSGAMKDFMDRLIPAVDPHFQKDEAGEYRHVSRYDRYPGVVVISNSGFPEQSHFQVLRLLFRRIARNMHSNVVAEIYRGGGEILKEKSLFVRPFTSGYLKTVRKAGREVVEKGGLSEETITKLEKPIVPIDMYIKGSHQMWDKMLKDNAASDKSTGGT